MDASGGLQYDRTKENVRSPTPEILRSSVKSQNQPPKQSTPTNTASNRRKLSALNGQESPLKNALTQVDLSHLSEEERNKVLNVVQRDLAIRCVEKERLKRFRSSILRRDREVASRCQELAESSNCLLCGQKFIILINPRVLCYNCNRPICRRCSETVTEVGGALCRLCQKETGYRAMRCNWFYDTVVSRFREFGSTAVAKSIFGDKLKNIQNLAEDELVNIILKYGRIEGSSSSVGSDQRSSSQSTDPLKDAQVGKLRKGLLTLMQNTRKEYEKVDQDSSLTAHQKYWQAGRIGVEFRKEAAVQMRNFSQSLYIATERQRTMQGNSSRHITQYVMSTLQDEISQIVGHKVQEQADNMSIASDDDLDSVVIAEREGVEDRLAQELLDKVLQDRQKGRTPVLPGRNEIILESRETTRQLQQPMQNGYSPSRNEQQTTKFASNDTSNVESDFLPKAIHLKVVEGYPTRMEVKVNFEEDHDFSWLYVTPEETRKPVKFDFHLEHVITASTKENESEPFVLSNSGHIGEQTMQTLLETHEKLKNLGIPNGVVIEHHLIIWAAKLEDSGRYIAVNRAQSTGGTSVLMETEFNLEVEQAHRWPMHPLHQPEFVQPLSIRTTVDSANRTCLELTCVIAGNPTPRCLFYRNSSPVPVVIMPLLTSEQDKTDILLSSFSRKYTIISAPCRHMVAAMSVGYLRSLTLRINRPSKEDLAKYTCRAWNYHGRVETSTRVTVSDLELKADEQGAPSLNLLYQAQPVTLRPTGIQQSLINQQPFDEQMHGNPQDVELMPRQSRNHTYAQEKVQPTSNDRKPAVTILYEQPSKAGDSKMSGKLEHSEISLYHRANYNGNSVIIDRPLPSPQSSRNNPKRELVIEKLHSNEPVVPQHSNQVSRAKPTSPTSSVFSENSNVVETPFIRNQSRRLSGPRVIIDRRSNRRGRRGSIASIVSQDNEIP